MSIAVSVIWIVGVCNAINLIDGLDGLAVGVSSIASISLLALTLISNNPNVAILTAAVAGAGFGFLPYNFNPAKIFMGDTGALFLGFILACISIEGCLKVSAIISFAIPILILGLPIFDTLFAILRRVLTGRSPMSPDRGHLHHRLLDMGFSQKQVVAILYTMTTLLCLTAVVISVKGYFRGILLILAVLLIIMVSVKLMGELRDPEKNNDIGYNDDLNLTNLNLAKECDCMKKKYFVVIAIIVVLVILLTPVRMNLKDGGSVRYKALVYEVTKIHRLAPEVDGVKPYIDGFEIKILGMTVYRETNE